MLTVVARSGPHRRRCRQPPRPTVPHHGRRRSSC